jgi:hypothetical protein
MEQPCYKCGIAVEQGIPFCPHCAAPQIRVVIAEAVPAPAALPGSVASSEEADVLPVSPIGIALPLRWAQILRPCALAALVASVAMVLKLIAPLIAVVGAGFFAVSLYRRSSLSDAIRPGSGARLGALCGLLSFGMTAVLEGLKLVILQQGEEIRKYMLDAIQQSAVRLQDPQYQPTLDFMRSPAGLVMMTVFFAIAVLLMFLLLGTVGGALGGALLGRRNKT